MYIKARAKKAIERATTKILLQMASKQPQI